MYYKLSIIQATVAAFTLCTSMAGHAQITKCVDVDGHISYSNDTGACAQTDKASFIADTPAPPGPVTVQGTPRAASRFAKDRTATAGTAWAQMPAVLRHASTDSATVREASANLHASDRALSSLRTQKLAFSR